MFGKLLLAHATGNPSRNSGRSRARGSLFRPSIERLEERAVLSTLYGLSTNNVIVRFDSTTPNTINSAIVVNGLQPGELLKGIDFRPLTGQLYGLGIVEGFGPDDAAGRLYRIDLATGAATAVAASATPFSTTLADNADYGMDFNPASGGLRIVNDANQSLRVNPSTGLLTSTDATLAFASGDPNVGDDPAVVAVAYDQNFSGTPTTTLFGIDVANSILVRQGGVNGTPSPNTGQLFTVGSLDITAASQLVGFDTEVNVDTGGTRAFALITSASTGLTGLYTINLSTGAVNFVGNVSNGAIPMTGLAVAPTTFVAVGPRSGSPRVRVFDGESGAVRFDFLAYPSTFTGGVRVAVGDVNRDGVPDIITAPGPGASPQVKVFSGTDGSLLVSTFAFATTFKGGVNVAAGDVNNDGADDIIVGSGTGGGRVRVFSVLGGVTQIRDFLAYTATFTGGVNVAAGDVNFDGLSDIIVGPASGARPVKVFSGLDSAALFTFFPYSTTYAGGVFVAAGDIDGDGRVEVITGRNSGLSTVKTFNVTGATAVQTNSFTAYGSIGGVRVAAGDTNGDGRAEIITAPGPGVAGKVRSLDGLTLAEVDAFFAYTATFTGGVFVGAGRG